MLLRYGVVSGIRCFNMHLESCSSLEIVLIFPPLRRDYQQLLPPNLLANEIRPLIADSAVRVLDFSSDSDFMVDDFYDFDHLNPRGAEVGS